MKKRRDFSNLSGKYGKWTIIEKVPADSKRRSAYYVCRCKCGTERKIRGTHLVNKVSTSCGVYPCRPAGKNNKTYRGLSGTAWLRITRGAAQRQIELNLTIEEAWRLFERQKGRCALTGVKLTLRDWRAELTCRSTASLDRIDPTKGYSIDNVWWLHKDVNLMKRDFTMARFLELCRAIVKSKYAKKHRTSRRA